MTETASKIRFKAKLLQPQAARATWAFLVLPRDASAKLSTRSATTVQGTINGHSFRATLEPDGRLSHWLKVDRKMRDTAKVDPGDLVTLEIEPSARELETRVPPDLRRALAADPKARAVWMDISPVARRDWISWITSAKRSETRAKRVAGACDMLGSGKRRVCCFDRSGYYSQGFSAPKAAKVP